MRYLLEQVLAIVNRHNRLQDAIVESVFEKWAVNFTYVAFAFVFFYFGIQKPAPVDSPVRVPVSVFINDLFSLLSVLFQTEVQIPVEWAILFIGTYEMFLGLLFLFKRIRLAFWLFFVHQAVGFLAIILPYDVVFQPPWISIGGLDIPWALGTFSSFVLKNVVFIGAFMFLASAELGANEEKKATEDSLDCPDN